MKPARFGLSKWYMDCVSPDGDAVLAYAAHLRWRNLAIAYESVLEIRGGGPPASRCSLKAHADPVVDGTSISWHSKPLGVEARWSGAEDPIRETIYRSPGGSVRWSCVLPAGEARVETSAGPLAGHGYVEHLHVTVAPWRLPIRSLRWGRISAADLSIVWIHWVGEFQAALAYADGERLQVLSAANDRVELGDGTVVSLDGGRIVRQGALGTTIGAMVPALRRLGPVRVLAVEECKSLSRATVTRPGRAGKDTWAIHELVTWPTTSRRRPA